jgi:hypothetical protein
LILNSNLNLNSNSNSYSKTDGSSSPTLSGKVWQGFLLRPTHPSGTTLASESHFGGDAHPKSSEGPVVDQDGSEAWPQVRW